MEKLFSTFSITEIVMFIILLAIAIKGFVTFFDWAKERLSKKFKKEGKQEKIEHTVNKYFEQQQEMKEQLNSIADRIELLISSDKEDIKAYITESHRKFCDLGWIDNYHREIIEKRFSYYRQEGGNSFILSFMEDLRELPSKPPEDN